MMMQLMITLQTTQLTPIPMMRQPMLIPMMTQLMITPQTTQLTPKTIQRGMTIVMAMNAPQP
jgi:hypothetical protein